MAAPDELRSELAAARADFAEAVRLAAAAWERKPKSGEGEAGWSARVAAEHTIGLYVYYASAVCITCGYPGLERWQEAYGTADEALRGLEEATRLSDGRLKYVTEKDLVMKNQRGNTVEGIMRHAIEHFRDHAAQIRAAAGLE